MQNPNKSKYPEIVIDKNANMGSGSHNNRMLTVEEYYDLLHHTHSISDILDDEGYSPSELGGLVEEMKNTMDTMAETITQANETIEALRAKVADNAQVIENLTQGLVAVDQQIETINHKLEEAYQVSDYDATTPEIEDEDGNIITVLDP